MSAGESRPKRSLYEILGVSPQATEEEIRQAYRSLALKHHPDRHSPENKAQAEERFKKINDAYNILRDSEKRRLYDHHGEDAARQADNNSAQGGGGMPMDPFNIFASMFQGHRQGGPPASRVETIEHVVNLTLEEMYNGTHKKLRINCNVKCSECNGTGVSKSASVPASTFTCRDCRGQRVQIRTIQIGPFLQQSQTPCPTCNATGEVIPPAMRCENCSGEKVISERKTREVEARPGTKNNDFVLLRGEGDFVAGSETCGDIAIIFRQGSEHRTFRRVDNDLYMNRKLSLHEALCGFRFRFKHLDNRIIEVGSSEVTKCIRPGETKAVLNEGMPIRDSSGQRGTLFIVFDVEYPLRNQVSPALQDELLKLACNNNHASSDAELTESNPTVHHELCD